MALRILNTRVNDGTRTLASSIVVPEVAKAFRDWTLASKDEVMLIGGLAMSYYVRPRATMDIDFLVLSGSVPDEVEGFKKTRPHGFLHKETHVEVEVLTQQHLKLRNDLFQYVMRHAVIRDGVRIPSPAGLIALKVQRNSLQDQADIAALLNSGLLIDLTGCPLTPQEHERIQEITSSVKHEKP